MTDYICLRLAYATFQQSSRQNGKHIAREMREKRGASEGKSNDIKPPQRVLIPSLQQSHPVPPRGISTNHHSTKNSTCSWTSQAQKYHPSSRSHTFHHQGSECKWYRNHCSRRFRSKRKSSNQRRQSSSARPWARYKCRPRRCRKGRREICRTCGRF